MANDIRNNRIDGTLHDKQIFGKEGHGDRRNRVTIAAEPDTIHHPLRSDGDRQVLEAGWHKLALSTTPTPSRRSSSLSLCATRIPIRPRPCAA
ncbi:hypothetical protein ABZ383_32555 [Streptomyces sp. NPDC005900]|uniref:hypothetical protein n=1 Tax=Streptomyces sp. NPDC005900 TaxID=3154569 RepID=UPI0033C4EB3F